MGFVLEGYVSSYSVIQQRDYNDKIVVHSCREVDGNGSSSTSPKSITLFSARSQKIDMALVE
jgi:hypothetical protein